MPFVSKQKGRISHLLKQKSKIGVEQKERTKYEVFNFEKRWRGSDGSVKYIQSGQQPKAEEKKNEEKPFKPLIQDVLEKPNLKTKK